MAYFRAVPLDAQPWLSDEPSGAVGGVDEHGRPYCTIHGPMANRLHGRTAQHDWLCLDPTCGVAARMELVIEEDWMAGLPYTARGSKSVDLEHRAAAPQPSRRSSKRAASTRPGWLWSRPPDREEPCHYRGYVTHLSRRRADNPFSPHSSVPRRYVLRSDVDAVVSAFVGSLESSRYAGGLALHGARGMGKSAILRRLHLDLADRGWLSVHVRLRSGESSSDDVATAINSEIERFTATQKTRRNPWKDVNLKATAKVPFVPLEFELTRTAGTERAPLDDALSRVLLCASTNLMPSAILIDEGDFMNGPGYLMRGVYELLYQAAESDLPILVAVTGASRRGLMEPINWAAASDAFRLRRFHHLQRLEAVQSHALLVETAAMVGDDWSTCDLEDAIKLCRGVPYSLQLVGHHIYENMLEFASQDAISRAVDSVRDLLGQDRARLSPSLRIAQRSCDLFLGGGVASDLELAVELSARMSLTLDEALNLCSDLEGHGLLEMTALGQCRVVDL